jgi:hypothetical protein
VAGFGHAQACALVAKLPSYIFTRPTQAASAPGDTKEQNLGVALMRCERYGAPALLIEWLRFLLIRPIDHIERHSSFEHFSLEVGCMGFPFGRVADLKLGFLI